MRLLEGLLQLETSNRDNVAQLLGTVLLLRDYEASLGSFGLRNWRKVLGSLRDLFSDVRLDFSLDGAYERHDFSSDHACSYRLNANEKQADGQHED